MIVLEYKYWRSARDTRTPVPTMIQSPGTPLTFDFGPARQKAADPLIEREHVKERLALAYRVIAHEQLCRYTMVNCASFAVGY